MIRGVLSDVHGVLYVHPRAIPGSPAGVRRLQTSGFPHLFLTNTSLRPKSRILASLREAGIEIPPDRLLTAVEAAGDHLRGQGFRRIGWLCAPALVEDLEGLIAVDPSGPDAGGVDAVLVGDMGDGFTYPVLNRAFRWLHEGARLVAIGRNRYYQAQSGLVLDSGPFVSLLETAAETRAHVAGKPSPVFFRAALDRLGLSPGESAMIGDDFEGDVRPAMEIGLRGILVRTGKFRPERYAPGPGGADVVVADFAEAVDSLLDPPRG